MTMITRYTHVTSQRNTLVNLQTNLAAMSKLQAQASSGKNLQRPSDDPAAAGDAMRLRADRKASEQYLRNMGDGGSWLTTADRALQTAVDALRQARDLTVQGANEGSMNAAAREATALAIEGARDNIFAQANATYLGRSVFAGTSDASAAFQADYSFSGTAGSSVERRISDVATVRVDADGAAVFGTGASSVFAMLDEIATTLRSGGSVSSYLNDIDSRMDVMLSELAGIGARQERLEIVQSQTEAHVASIGAQISSIEDIDLAQVLTDLKLQEVSYQSALGAASRVLQPTLLDFLR